MIIYKVSNSINEKSYIGKTVKSLQLRKLSHLKNLRLGHHSKLYDAMRKYGVDVFIWEQIISCDNIENLNELEIFYIQKYDTYKNGYNMTLGGDGGDTISMKSNEEKKRQGTKIGNIPWNKGISMKQMGYVVSKNRKPRNKFTEEEKKSHSLKIKNSETYRSGLKNRIPSKQIIIGDDLGNIWNKLKDFKSFIGLSRYIIMTSLLKGDWLYNNRTYHIISKK